MWSGVVPASFTVAPPVCMLRQWVAHSTVS